MTLCHKEGPTSREPRPPVPVQESQVFGGSSCALCPYLSVGYLVFGSLSRTLALTLAPGLAPYTPLVWSSGPVADVPCSGTYTLGSKVGREKGGVSHFAFSLEISVLFNTG